MRRIDMMPMRHDAADQPDDAGVLNDDAASRSSRRVSRALAHQQHGRPASLARVGPAWRRALE